MKYAIVSAENKVSNIIELSEGSGWKPPVGSISVAIDDQLVSMGWNYSKSESHFFEFTQEEITQREAAVPAYTSRIRSEAIATIDKIAEDARQRYITPGAGQSLTYLRKEQDARAWVADGFLANCPPFVAASARGAGVSEQDAALAIIARADAWALKGAAIEGYRLGGKRMVHEASDVNAIREAMMAAIAILNAC